MLRRYVADWAYKRKDDQTENPKLSLDSTSENYIQRTIQNLRKKQKTIIVIAHRLSTVVNADCIVLLENGKVIEQGSHSDLYKKQGHYYNLWSLQIPMLNGHDLSSTKNKLIEIN